MAEGRGLPAEPSSRASASFPRGTVLAGALGVGVAGDLLLRSAGGPGLNVFLLFVVLAVSLGLVSGRAGLRPSGEAVAWIAAGLLFAAAVVLRAAPALQLLAFLAASAAFALPALRAGQAWLRGSGVSDYLEAIGAAVLRSALGPALRVLAEWIHAGSPSRVGSGAGGGPSAGAEAPVARGAGTARPSRRRTWGVVRGALLAAPLLFAFGALFMSADRVFAEMVTGLFRVVDLEEVASRLAVIGVLAWPAYGYLSGFVTGTRVRGWLEPAGSRPSIGILEAGTMLALVDFLFAVFVLVQVRYLFGGSALVEVTPGLTYAEYAREGFVQLVVAAGLVLPCLLASDWLLRRERRLDEWTFRVLGGAQLLFLIVVIASAFQRLRVYQEAYGLTESRFYGAAFLAWLSLLSLWFAATILRGTRARFAAPAMVSGFLLVAALLAANPDERIARTNLARGEGFDAAYLGSLSADAVPTLLGALPELPPEARCTVARRLEERWGTEARGDWRSWNRSEARARRLVREAPAEAVSARGCPDP